MEKTGAEILIYLLERQGIDTIAGIPGGANLPIYDALGKSKIRHILARHEQGAGFIAHGMARSTGKPAVCFATSGPGATNVMTAIADAKLDSVPMITITGQVPISMVGTDAFQEVDTYGMTIPITKHNFLVRDANELFEVIPEAFAIAVSGRPGPVVIDVPKDVQKQKVSFSEWPENPKTTKSQSVNPQVVDRIVKTIQHAEKPLLYIGGGVIHADVNTEIQQLAEKNGLPVVSTLMGLGAFPTNDPKFLGMLGMHGEQYTNILLEEIDLLIALGVRFDDRATGKVEAFCPNASIIHVDVDNSEINKIKDALLSMQSDLQPFLKSLLPKLPENPRKTWWDEIQGLKKTYPVLIDDSKELQFPVALIRKFSEFVEPDTVVTTDVGQHQMWVAQAYPFQRSRTLLTSGGLGTMGFGLPAAIGASLAHPGKRVLCFSGDGSILMNIQELGTLAELNLPVTVILMNNHHLGLVRQQQELFYNQQYVASKFEKHPDFSALARDFGIPSIDLAENDDMEDAIQKSIEMDGPCLLHAAIDPAENVFPMVPPGAANKDMIGGAS